jgi:hypothetical protein
VPDVTLQATSVIDGAAAIAWKGELAQRVLARIQQIEALGITRREVRGR